MKPYDKGLMIIAISFTLALTGCALLEGDFGLGDPEGEHLKCTTNYETCIKRCQVMVGGVPGFKEFHLKPEECKKP